MTTGISKTDSGVKLNEPVLAAFLVTWALAQAGTFIVGRTHLVTDKEWSALSSTLAPIIITFVLGAIGWIVRSLVRPAWKFIDDEAGKVGLSIPDVTVVDGKAPDYDFSGLTVEPAVTPTTASAVDIAKVNAAYADGPGAPAATDAETPQPLVLTPDETQA